MKTLKTFSGLALSAVLIFTSCKKSDNTTSSTPGTTNNPTINLVAGTGYISADYTITAGSMIRVKAISLSNSTSGSKLANLHETVTSNNVNLVDTTITYSASITSHADSVVTPAPSVTVATGYRISYTITDKAGLSASVSVNITVVPAPPTIQTIGSGSAITLGGSVDTNPSYVNLYTGTTLSSSAVTSSNAASIDLVYNKTKVYSPSDPLETNTTVKGAGVITKMDIYTAKAYNTITASDIAAYTPTGATNATLANGSVVMFLTNAGKKGVFQVTAFNGSATSTTTDNISFIGQIQQ